jgi:hypothetical protein
MNTGGHERVGPFVDRLRTLNLSEIGSCTFWSSNVWGPDCVSLTNSQYAIHDGSLVVLLPLGTSACNYSSSILVDGCRTEFLRFRMFPRIYC